MKMKTSSEVSVIRLRRQRVVVEDRSVTPV